jgi:hypothetical protein
MLERSKSMKFYRRTVVFLVLVVAMLLQGSAMAASSEDFIYLQPTTDPQGTLATPFAKLYPADGMAMQFVMLKTADGRDAGIMIATTLPAHMGGVEKIEGLRGANPLEIFNAMSVRGTKIPRELLAAYGRPKLGQQGWALPLPLVGGGVQAQECAPGADPFSLIEGDVEWFASSMYFLSEADGPSTQPNHWSDDNGPADGTIRRKLNGGVNNVTEYFSRVSYCFEDESDYPLNFHGRFVTVKARISNFLPAWGTELNVQLMDPGDDASVQVYALPGEHVDVRLAITAARPGDLFHIGATWGSPDGYFTLGD